MINDMPEEIYALSGRSDSFDGVYDTYQWPDQSGTKYIRADKAIPEGYALVPKEPTEEMLVAGEKEVPFVYDMYTAMIAAAQEKNDE